MLRRNHANFPPANLARGDLGDDAFTVSKFGHGTVDIGATVVWSLAATLDYPWPDTAETVQVQAGGDAADTAAGLGAQTVVVEGLDENWNRASETLTLAGASASLPSTTIFRRVFRAYVATSGAYGAPNTGNIIIEHTTSSDNIAIIDAEAGQTEMALYTIPAGYTGFVQGYSILVDGNQRANVQLVQRQGADVVAAPFRPPRVLFSPEGVGLAPVSRNLPQPLEVPEKTDIYWTAQSQASTTHVTIDYEILCIKTALAGEQ
jgi:hypothetical protein